METPNRANSSNADANGVGAGGSGTGNSVEHLLREFDQQNGSQSAAQSLPHQLQPVIDFAQAEMQAKQAKEFATDVEEAVAFISDIDEAKDLPKRVPKGFLHDLANEDQTFAEAWFNRKQRPGAYKDALAKAKKMYLDEVVGKLPTSKIRTDVEAAAAAVQGQTSTPASGAKSVTELAKMNLRELREYGRSLEARRG